MKEVGSISARFIASKLKWAVLSEEEPSEELVADFLSAKRRCYRKTLPFSLIIALILLFISLAIDNFSIYLLFLGTAILCGFLFPRLDFDYNYLKQEMNWYGCS